MYLITDLDVGGAEKCLYNLVTRLDQTKFTPTVACLNGHGKIGNCLAEAGVNVIYLDMEKQANISVMFKLRRVLNDLRIDILHTFLFHANIIGRISARLTGRQNRGTHRPRVICSVRVAEKRKYHLLLDRWTHWLMDIETCVSRSVRRFTINAGIPAEKLVVVPNGIDLNKLRPLPIDFAKSQFGIEKDVMLIVSIGRLEEQKGMRYLIEAARELTPQLPDVKCAIVGHGHLEDALKQQVKQAGMSGKVMFLGWQDDIRSILSACDIFVLPSLWEGMPNVILEAMACAKPVISTDVDGCSELVIEGETGRLVPPADPQALAQAIRDMAHTPVEAREMGVAGQKLARDHFCIDRMVALNEDLYSSLIGGSQRAPRDLNRWTRHSSVVNTVFRSES